MYFPPFTRLLFVRFERPSQACKGRLALLECALRIWPGLLMSHRTPPGKGKTGMSRRRHIAPFEVEIRALGKGGVGIGDAPDGKEIWVKPAPPGSRIHVHPMGFRKGRWQGRRVSMVRPPEEAVEPSCSVFGLCGGCQLQELALPAQQKAKERYALTQVATPRGCTVEELAEECEVHEVRSTGSAYHYRNKVELSFGGQRYLSEADHRAGLPIDGRFLGFHAPGRFDRVVDVERCWLISDEANALLGAVRESILTHSELPLWNPRTHQGFWRHAVIRQGMATGELLLCLYSRSVQNPEEQADVEAALARLQEVSLPEGASLVGLAWFTNDGVADVARGDLQFLHGRPWLEEHLGTKRFKVSIGSFFQTSTAGAVLLYDTLKEACGEVGGDLYDLYCGTGSIGIYLTDAFDKVIGVEEVEQAIENAWENAQWNGVEQVSYFASKMEDALDLLPEQNPEATLLVDPPRAGLHPKVAKQLAKTPGKQLLYVACNPASLGRDTVFLEEGHWKLVQLWTVDLFPQTGHIEMIGRFVRKEEA